MQHKDIIIGHLPSGASIIAMFRAMFRASMTSLILRITPKRKAVVRQRTNEEDGWQPFVAG